MPLGALFANTVESGFGGEVKWCRPRGTTGTMQPSGFIDAEGGEGWAGGWEGSD